MAALLAFLRASTLADLPPVARQYFTDDEQFIEVFAGLDDDEKSKGIATALQYCLEANLTTDREILRMTALTVQGSYDEYEEKRDEDTAEAELEVVVPTIAMPVPVVAAPAPVVTPPAKKPRAKPDPNAPKKPRGRPPKYPDAKAFPCEMCEIGFASHGSLYNHFHSKPHKEKVLDFLREAPNMMSADKVYKVVVETRNKKEGKDLGLTQEHPDEGTFLDLIDHVRDSENAVAYISLAVGNQHTYPSGRSYYSWNKVL